MGLEQYRPVKIAQKANIVLNILWNLKLLNNEHMRRVPSIKIGLCDLQGQGASFLYPIFEGMWCLDVPQVSCRPVVVAVVTECVECNKKALDVNLPPELELVILLK